MKQGPEFGEVGALEDLARLQRHVAWQTLQFVVPRSAPGEDEFIRLHPAVRVDALENYIRGLLAPGPEEKRRFFTQAVRLEPNYSQPCFQLGRQHLQKNEYKIAAEWLQKVSTDDVHYREATFPARVMPLLYGRLSRARRPLSRSWPHWCPPMKF